MHRIRLLLAALALVTTAISLSCGSSQMSQRQLQSVTLLPATADAQDFPGGLVPFTATGHYSMSPETVTPLTAFWGACYQGASTTDVTVSQSGIAQCASGAVGTYTVWANGPSPGGSCLAMTACGGGCFVVGSATLTCP